MDKQDKFSQAVQNLRPNTKLAWNDEITTEEEFNKVKWQTGVDGIGSAIFTTTNPYAELTWTKVKAEMDAVQSKYDALEYARNRQKEYPVMTEFLAAYTEKEIGGDSTKWDAYIIKYNKTRSDNPKG